MSSTPCRSLLFLGPVIAYFIAKRTCLALQKKDREIALHGYESGRIVRLPGGEYIEVHEPVDEYERWKLVSHESYQPLMIRPNARGTDHRSASAPAPACRAGSSRTGSTPCHADRDRSLAQTTTRIIPSPIGQR